ncbi:MAG TPA: Fur family transcriptional regulator [Fibrobacteria bacterium]|nr:Fur family transcriptional regulator [Fibrobacteria bacterium]HOX53203.1 Fur family transcriptional regulator [Fibrobacteria bacterium]
MKKTPAVASAKPVDFEEALERYRDYLRRKKLLFTRERIAILEEVMARHDHFSVEELHDSLKLAGKKVSRATLYRNLDSLKEAGILAEVDLGNRHVQYEHVLGHRQHFHLVNEDSGEVLEDDSVEIEKAVETFAHRHGFQVSRIKLQIFGLPLRK